MDFKKIVNQVKDAVEDVKEKVEDKIREEIQNPGAGSSWILAFFSSNIL